MTVEGEECESLRRYEGVSSTALHSVYWQPLQASQPKEEKEREREREREKEREREREREGGGEREREERSRRGTETINHKCIH